MPTAVKKKITIIPPDPIHDTSIKAENKLLKVAAYCRVSTEQDEQESSYKAQIDYYTEKINNTPSWKLAGIYADDGKSATNMKRRDDFNTLISDCMKGKIDLVLTKSVSRFARNTVDSLTTIRKLKAKNIGIYFEKENVNTLEATGEILITILSSLAQEESRNISENVRWGIARKFEKGTVIVNHNKFMGYTKDNSGNLVIVPEEAEVVKTIFRLYLEGSSLKQIAKHLEAAGVKTATGGDKWADSVIDRMLVNEKYMGDALFQKTYTVDYLTKKRIKNKGHVKQYYVEDNHEAIISKDLFYRVQEEKLRRANTYRQTENDKESKSKFSSKYALTDLMTCNECGHAYRRVTWYKEKKRYYKWRCDNRLQNGKKNCKNSPSLEEKYLYRAIMDAINQVVENRGDFVGAFRQNVIRVMGSYKKQKQTDIYDKNIEKLQMQMVKLIEANAKKGYYSEEFDKEYQQIAMQIKELQKKKEEDYQQQRLADSFEERVEEVDKYIKEASCRVTEYDDDLVRRLITSIKVISKDKILIQFKSGIVKEQRIEYDD